MKTNLGTNKFIHFVFWGLLDNFAIRVWLLSFRNLSLKPRITWWQPSESRDKARGASDKRLDMLITGTLSGRRTQHQSAEKRRLLKSAGAGNIKFLAFFVWDFLMGSWKCRVLKWQKGWQARDNRTGRGLIGESEVWVQSWPYILALTLHYYFERIYVSQDHSG